MTKSDVDMVRMSSLLAEARSISIRRHWRMLGYFIDQSDAVLLGIEPGDGEKGTVEFRPLRSRYKPEAGEW
jgi:hypothetical protein